MRLLSNRIYHSNHSYRKKAIYFEIKYIEIDVGVKNKNNLKGEKNEFFNGNRDMVWTKYIN